MTKRYGTADARVEFPACTPEVSVVVLAVRRPDLLDRCLRSLLATVGDGVPFEVVVVLNAATPDVVDYVDSMVTGVTVLRQAVNLGLAGGLNRAFAAARARRIAIVHDDSAAQPGWLVSLLATADANPDAGVVGSRVHGRDGHISDVGWILWRDGTTSPPWTGTPPPVETFAQVRAVDYHGLVGALVDREAWESVGGFDDDFYPAYYEDVDFCLRLRSAGWRVLYDPGAVFAHYVSASTEHSRALFMARRSRRRLLARHGFALIDHGRPSGEPGALAREFDRAASAEEGRRGRRTGPRTCWPSG